MLQVASGKQISAPSIPSKWHLDNKLSQEAKHTAQEWRDLGKNIALNCNEYATKLQGVMSPPEIEAMVKTLLATSQWVQQNEGYVNLLLGQRCLDVASVGIAKLLADLSLDQALCAKLVETANSLTSNIEKERNVLNSEAGVEIFSKELTRAEMEKVWGNGKISARASDEVVNAAFFREKPPVGFANSTTVALWDQKFHERIVFGLELQNVDRINCLSKFRTAVGHFPETGSTRGLRPGREGAFYKTWLKNATPAQTTDEMQARTFRITGILAWESYKLVIENKFYDVDTLYQLMESKTKSVSPASQPGSR